MGVPDEPLVVIASTTIRFSYKSLMWPYVSIGLINLRFASWSNSVVSEPPYWSINPTIDVRLILSINSRRMVS